ncbi:MAG: O-antigen ligase family protein [Crocinitomicaceae bacterium]|nr:O-antigen ligase family protein [Crocinitomicaceae bacterium]
MTEKLSYNSIYTGLFCLFAFSFAWNLQISTVLIILLFGVWLMDKNTSIKSKLNAPFKDKRVLILISSYVLALIGLLNTDNLDHGVFILGVSASLFLLPLIFYSLENRTFDRKRIHFVLVSFVAGMLTSSLYCLLISYLKYSKGDVGMEVFEYVELMNVVLSPGSYGNYLTFSILLVLLYLVGEYKFARKPKLIPWLLAFALLVFFLVIMYLLQSKAALLAAIMIIGLTIAHKVTLLFSWKVTLAGALVIGVLFFFSGLHTSILGERFEAMSQNLENLDKKSETSSALRFAALEGSYSLAVNNPLIGVGTGAVKGRLTKYYAKHGYYGAHFHKTDTHNQFLRSFAKNGFLGLILVIITFLLPLILAIKMKSFLLFAFGMLEIVMGMTGDILDSQPGVVFYAFTICFLIFIVGKSSSERTKTIPV